ncbi:uncharacterized protein LOC133727287 [Rosa rugosa]|uniref:uncharacterized protein LOC133707951 n=1 Tax=Rosa rugosa TaxID=74645 RepID=UPI002B41491B|nr:uncharacterized protein LOC133707951 [Rosa rugosa]XP_062010870.1 uncharacterized protein LOC133727287 [Rosa rugosa]
MHRLKSTLSRNYSMKRQPSTVTADTTAPSVPHNESTMSLGLSSRQITLLLSSIWAQSISPLNTPEIYQAIAHTYSLVLLYARTKWERRGKAAYTQHHIDAIRTEWAKFVVKTYM